MLAGLVGLAGVLLIAAATPRQADLFGTRPGRTLRLAGFVVLALSLGLVLGGGTRGLIGWVGLMGVEALAVALACTLLSRRGPRAAGRSPARRR